MRIRGGLLLVTLAMTMYLIPSPATAAQSEPPVCIDSVNGWAIPATKWLDAPGTLIGTPGDDVMVGSSGSDVIRGLGGNDLICTGPNYRLALDDVDGGTGNDFLFGNGTLKGGAGDDRIFPLQPGSVGIGGSGRDYIYALYGASIEGGAGDDIVFGSGASRVDGGSGNDSIHVDTTPLIFGGSGDDTISDNNGAATVDCGSGTDSIYANSGPSRRCEITITS